MASLLSYWINPCDIPDRDNTWKRECCRPSSSILYRAQLRIDVCVDNTRPGLAVEIRRLKDTFIDAKRRHVKIRYITEITKDNFDYCKELISIVDELRHLDGIKGNFYVSEFEYAHHLPSMKGESLQIWWFIAVSKKL